MRRPAARPGYSAAMGPVLVLGDSRKKGVAAAVEAARPRLEKDFGIAATDLEGKLDLARVPAKWALVFGGDGAILAVSRRMGARPIPTIAVNLGRLGFLTELQLEQLPEALDRIRAGNVQIRDRTRLLAERGPWKVHALNDVVVSASLVGRMFYVSLSIRGGEEIRYAGDGVVVASPTGSTAYSLAAGGPIVDPDLDAIVVTPLCAHTLSQRPIVVPGDHAVELWLRDGDPPGHVAVDGQEVKELRGGDRLRVTAAPEPFPLIRVGLRSYYERLRDLLGWSGQPRYAGGV